MTAVSIVSLLDRHSSASQRESLAAWLVFLDGDQDGKIQEQEVQDPKGLLRCDAWTGRIGASRWRSLEKILRDGGLVKHRSAKACGDTADSNLPVAPGGRFPSAYYSQFFALPFDWVFVFQPDVSVKSLLKVLKPEVSKIHQGKTEIEITLKSGRQVTLALNATHQLQKVHYTDAKGQYSLLARLEFLEIFHDTGNFEKFFAKNPYYEEERQAGFKLYSPIFTTTEVPVLSPKQARKQCWKGILLFPDRHGNKDRYQLLHDMLSEESLDWFALEMLSHKLQSSVDDFLFAPEKSKRFRKAKQKLQNYLQPFWSSYFKGRKPDDDPYYRLLLLCRKRKIRVIALDSVAPYTTASQKFAPLSVATRNLIWSEQIPEEGRGIVFGGEFHFTRNRKARVQDFLLDRSPHRTIQRIDFDLRD